MSIRMNPSFSIATPYPEGMGKARMIGLTLFAVGVLFLLIAFFGGGSYSPALFFNLSISLGSVGAILYIYKSYQGKSEGVKNDGNFFNPLLTKGLVGWVLGIVFTGFYVLIYWFPDSLEHWVRMHDPLAYMISGEQANQWFVYGTLYTLAVLVMGFKAILKYWHSTYQVVRTCSVIFFQLGFAFLIPNILKMFGQPEFYFHYFWPLEYSYLFPSTMDHFSQQGSIGVFMVFWGALMTFVASPILTYFYGKRWYCSWVCGCGGLANTLGDPWRQLSDKSLKAWKFERWSVHLVLVFIVLTTGLLWTNSYMEGALLGELSQGFSKTYGFLIGSVFSGVIGVGFYPLMGTRVWCRFGCPMAAILGLQQKFFSRFRITTNGGQCISCGNCSTYCEMGIDVKWYAQRGQNIVRASCVGCGICSTVCPRGVLNLENGPVEKRVSGDPILVGNDSVNLNPQISGHSSN